MGIQAQQPRSHEENMSIPSVADSWINTNGGKKISLLHPSEDQIDIRDIAQGLANTCRYSGQVNQFYSVAEHSLLAARYVKSDNPRVKLAALMHDAAEAYIGDVTSPLKALLPNYQEIERQIESVIFKAFGIYDLLEDGRKLQVIHEVDCQLLATEVRDLVSHKHPSWEFDFEIIPDLNLTGPRLDPNRASRYFISTFWDLMSESENKQYARQ